MQIALEDIQPSPRPVRTSWDEQKLTELAYSIDRQGLLVPIKLRPVGEKYEIVYGHRRVEAIRQLAQYEPAKWQTVEAFVEGTDDTAALIQALIENVQREDMNPLDKAHALKALQGETGWSARELGKQGIVPDRAASYLLALLAEPTEIQEKVAHNVRTGITEHHVREVRESGLDEVDRVSVMDKAESEGLTGKQTRQVANAIANEPDPEVREELLQRPYDGNKRKWEALAHQKAKETKEIKEAGVSSFEWQARPEVSAVLSYLKNLEGDHVEEWYRIAEMGKFTPEGVRFFRGRLKRAGKTLLALADDLEKFEHD